MSAVKYREIIRLWFCGYSTSEIAQACGCARSTVQDYTGRASVSGLIPERLKELSDSELLVLIGKKPHRGGRSKKGPEVDWAWVSTELSRRGVTLSLLWEEQSRGLDDVYSYSTFCRRYREWKREHKVVSLQVACALH